LPELIISVGWKKPSRIWFDVSNLAIHSASLSKQYRIGGVEPYKALRDTLAGVFSSPARLLRSLFGDANSQTGDNRIWALRDVTFSVRHGETIGIIGRNGAGKSTLLKILSRITDPTSGYVDINGRTGSLLEVGTGFHAELTGRENIYFNGSLLGMKTSEIRSKFDEMVDFSGIEKFIDTPVKHYSSGMYMRLAFAVAAHLEPEILIVDEVLAVGDALFQRKCLNKMQQVGDEGRTVLFVSHNMSAVTRLCRRAILLNDGKIAQDGPSQEVVRSYLQSDNGTSAFRSWPEPSAAPGNDIVRLHSVRVRNEAGDTSVDVDIRRPVGIEMDYLVRRPGHVLVPNCNFFNQDGLLLFHTNDQNPEYRRTPRNPGHYRSTVWIPGNFLAEGTVIVGAAITTLDSSTVHFHERDAVAFHVVDSMDGDSARGDYGGSIPGVIRPLLNWCDDFNPDSQCPPPYENGNDAKQK
jgi:lipopolysaccharide transport system ATP-binding protein